MAGFPDGLFPPGRPPIIFACKGYFDDLKDGIVPVPIGQLMTIDVYVSDMLPLTLEDGRVVRAYMIGSDGKPTIITDPPKDPT